MWFELWPSLWLANELLKTLRAALKYLGEAVKMEWEGREGRRLSRTSGMTNSIKKVSRNVATMRQLGRGGSASASAGTALRCVALQCS